MYSLKFGTNCTSLVSIGFMWMEKVASMAQLVKSFCGSSSIKLLSTSRTLSSSSLQMYSGSFSSWFLVESSSSREWQPPMVSGRLLSLFLPSCSVWSLVMYPMDSGIDRRLLFSRFRCSSCVSLPIVLGSSKILLSFKIRTRSLDRSTILSQSRLSLLFDSVSLCILFRYDIPSSSSSMSL